MARIIRSPLARADVDEIAEYIAERNLEAALRWLDELDRQFKLLADFPGAGVARDEVVPGLRSLPFGNYLIFYRAGGGGVEIVRVLHGARDLRRVFRRRRKGRG